MIGGQLVELIWRAEWEVEEVVVGLGAGAAAGLEIGDGFGGAEWLVGEGDGRGECEVGLLVLEAVMRKQLLVQGWFEWAGQLVCQVEVVEIWVAALELHRWWLAGWLAGSLWCCFL